MSQPDPTRPTPGEQPADPPKGDPWQIVGYLVAGVGFYGGLGWLADRWLGTHFLVLIGILLGAGLGIFMTYKRLQAMAEPAPPTELTDDTDK